MLLACAITSSRPRWCTGIKNRGGVVAAARRDFGGVREAVVGNCARGWGCLQKMMMRTTEALSTTGKRGNGRDNLDATDTTAGHVLDVSTRSYRSPL